MAISMHSRMAAELADIQQSNKEFQQKLDTINSKIKSICCNQVKGILGDMLRQLQFEARTINCRILSLSWELDHIQQYRRPAIIESEANRQTRRKLKQTYIRKSITKRIMANKPAETDKVPDDNRDEAGATLSVLEE